MKKGLAKGRSEERKTLLEIVQKLKEGKTPEQLVADGMEKRICGFCYHVKKASIICNNPFLYKTKSYKEKGLAEELKRIFRGTENFTCDHSKVSVFDLLLNAGTFCITYSVLYCCRNLIFYVISGSSFLSLASLLYVDYVLLVAIILPQTLFINPVFPTLPWKIPYVFPVKVTYKTSTKKNAKAKTKETYLHTESC